MDRGTRRRTGVPEALAGTAALCLVLSLFVPWWSRLANEGKTTPLTWQSPATNINVPLFATLVLALALLTMELSGVWSPRARRVLWALPLVAAGLALLIAAVELGYLEVYGDARPGMWLGMGGLALAGTAAAVALARSSRVDSADVSRP